MANLANHANLINVRIGDYVFFESATSSPYLIRKIEELHKTPNGNIEAKCICLYRRRDLSQSLLALAERYQSWHSPLDEDDIDSKYTAEQIDQLKLREVFSSRKLETLPATGIRGKCSVTQLNEAENLLSYLNGDDAFFFTLVYDPDQKTLQQHKGDIRVGSKYQCDSLPQCDPDNYASSLRDELVWQHPSPIDEDQFYKFHTICKSVGLFARAVDFAATSRQSSFLNNTIAASRDCVNQFACDVLHNCDYDLASAMDVLVSDEGGPVLLRDQLEEWSAAETQLFADAMEQHHKDFFTIQQTKLPWKTLASIVEYYYMYKTTERYNAHRKQKSQLNESKPKKLVIPTQTKPSPALLSGARLKAFDHIPCGNCSSYDHAQWFAMSANVRLCGTCWSKWRKYGETNGETVNLNAVNGLNGGILNGAIIGQGGNNGIGDFHQLPNMFGVMKRPAFYLRPNTAVHLARRISSRLNSRKLSRNPCRYAVPRHNELLQECDKWLANSSEKHLPDYTRYMKSIKECMPEADVADWLVVPEPSEQNLPIRFPKPDVIPFASSSMDDERRGQMPINRKLGFHQINGISTVATAAIPALSRGRSPVVQATVAPIVSSTGASILTNHFPAAIKTANQNSTNSRTIVAPRHNIAGRLNGGGVSQDLTPEDMYFVRSTHVRTIRKSVHSGVYKKAARRPFKVMRAAANGSTRLTNGHAPATGSVASASPSTSIET